MKDLKQLREENAELRSILASLRKEQSDLEKINQRLNTQRVRMYESFMLEKMQLMERIGRLDQRIAALGFTPAKAVGVGIELSKP